MDDYTKCFLINSAVFVPVVAAAFVAAEVANLAIYMATGWVFGYVPVFSISLLLTRTGAARSLRREVRHN